MVAGGGCGLWWVVEVGGVIFCGDGISFVIPTKVKFGGCCVGVVTV